MNKAERIALVLGVSAFVGVVCSVIQEVTCPEQHAAPEVFALATIGTALMIGFGVASLNSAERR